MSQETRMKSNRDQILRRLKDARIELEFAKTIADTKPKGYRAQPAPIRRALDRSLRVLTESIDRVTETPVTAREREEKNV